MGFKHKTNLCFTLQLFLLLNTCFLSGFGTGLDTVRINKPLRDPETLVSDGQKFKLGFFSPPNSSYRYVGVMFNIPIMTVVWVANRDKPLNDSNGTVQISGDGNLVILDGQKQISWSTGLLTSVADTGAQLLDTGNLVLQENFNGKIIWESFGHATDSYLQRMALTADYTGEKGNNSLTSWRSPSDPASGSFTAAVEPRDIPEFVVRNGSDLYWRSGLWDGQIFIGVLGMTSSYQNRFYVVDDNPGSASATFSVANKSVLVYFLMDASGILQERCYDGKGGWDVVWSSITTVCDVYNKCGPFGSCNPQGTPMCTCLPGYEPRSKQEWNNGNWTSGCTRKTPLQCENNNFANKLVKDVFFKLETMKLPDQAKLVDTVEADCVNRCLNSCSCIAYSYQAGIGCMMWNESLTDIQKFSEGGATLYIRLAYSELGNKKKRKAIIAATVVLGFITFIICTYFTWKCLAKCRESQHSSSGIRETKTGYSKESELKEKFLAIKLEDFPSFRFEVLSNATGNFDSIHKLGQGGFGPVYKGQLPNGQEIAVKRLAKSSNQGLEEFMNEVEVISKLQHRNLVRLIGCCVEGEEKMLVYEYMSNGSLDAYIFEHSQYWVTTHCLDWRKRLIIIEGICRGLLYLHRDSRLRIIHRDLKASNILLDEEMKAKISDFGMARIFGGNEDQANTTRVVGTCGYMAPEYGLQGRFSEKSDVYSFGVLLLEIISGKRNTSFLHDDQDLSLIAWAWKLWKEGKILNLIDPLIYDQLKESEMLRYAHVGLLCVQDRAKERPNVSTVLSMLGSEISELPHPTQPAFVANQRSSSHEVHSKYSVNSVTTSIAEGR